MSTNEISRNAIGERSLSVDLTGKVAIVTGAGRGLGRACSLRLADAGAHVVLLSRTRNDLEEVYLEIAGRGRSSETAVCDVTDDTSVSSIFGGLERIDILVNNAGMNRPQPFMDTPAGDLDMMLSLNVRAMFIVAQIAARRMAAEGGGVIVNMTSQMGHVGAPDRSVYCMTKHAIEGLTKAIAVELAPMNIRVNAVAPTFAETPMTRSFFKDKPFLQSVLERIPLGRLASAEDIAEAVFFLASPAARSITGHSLLVDGGWTAQ